VVAIDGVRCVDRSAPEQRLNQLIAQYRDAWKYLVARPATDREKTIATALRMERGIAPMRGDDEVLCGGGIQQMADAVEKNPGATREVPTAPGHFGRTIEIQPNPKANSQFLDRSVSAPLQESACAAMPVRLAQLIGLGPAK
jgi:hypothetical protein